MYHLVNLILFQDKALLAFIDVGVNASRESKLGGDTGQVVLLYHVVRVPYDGVVTIPDLKCDRRENKLSTVGNWEARILTLPTEALFLNIFTVTLSCE